LTNIEAPQGAIGQPEPSPDDQTGETIVPLLAEELTVTKQTVDTGRVQVARVTHHREQLVDEVLASESVEIERIPIGRLVDLMPTVREDGETTVVPIIEEVLVVERRLFLKEEVHIRRVRTTKKHLETVSLRHQEAVVTRLPVEALSGARSAVQSKSQQSNEEEKE
jgi:uncharacterized protein (TIGR02271 family)